MRTRLRWEGGVATTALVALALAGAARRPVAGVVDAASKRPDTLVHAWASSATGTPGGLASVRVRVDFSEADGAHLGGVRGRLRFEPAFLSYEEYARGDAPGELEVDDRQAAEGVLSFGVDPPEGEARATSAALLEVTFRVTGPPGTRAAVILELEALTSADGVELLGRTVVRDGGVVIR